MATYFRIRDGVAVEKIVPPDGVEIGAMFTPEFVKALIQSDTADIGWVVGSDGKLKAPTNPGLTPDPVPASVSRAQAKIQLFRAGLLDQVKVLIDEAAGEVEIWFADATVWERTNPHVVTLGAVLQLSEAEIDDLFRQAATIQA